MTFSFKQTSADFRVSEELPFTLAGKGEALYVYIEKRNMTTQEVILHLRKRLKLSRLSLGIAGLKDKKAIAKQWISIYDRALKKAGGERLFVDTLAEIVKIVEVTRHPFPLNLSTPITNTFSLNFKAQKHLGQQERQEAQEIVKALLAKGYPNFYGEQRFGIRGRNTAQGRELLHGISKEKKEMTKADMVFKMQAFASHVFNEFVNNIDATVIDGTILTWTEQNTVKWGVYDEATKWVIETEIKGADTSATFAVKTTGKHLPYTPASMVATGPVLGRNLPLPPASTKAGQREAKFLEEYLKDKAMFAQFSAHKIFGLRRPLWVIPSKANAQYHGDDLQITFTLPSWAYASIVFDELTETLVRG